MDPPSPLLPSNDHIQISESINNAYDYYSNGSEDTYQQNPCSCNNCLSTASNFQLPYDNDNNYMNISESPLNMQQHNIIEQNSPISSTKEQCINNDQQFLEQVQPQSVPNISSSNNQNDLCVNSSSTTINSQSSYTELFRVEISGIEIIFRKKILLNSNHNLEMRTSSPQNDQPPGIRAGRIQNRVHPYQMPAGENCRYNKINYRNPNSIQKIPYYTHFSSMAPQLNQQIIDSYQ